MEKNSKIYIAGHTGLVGSALLRGLKAQGFENPVCREAKDLDLRRQAAVERFFEEEKPEYVFLAAAKVGGILANSTYTAEFIYDNLIIAANIINAARLSGVKKLLNLGSSCVYPRLAPQPIKEESLLASALEPTNEPYAIAKIAAIKLCRYYNEQYGADFISVMPTNLYGPGDNFNLETAHVLPALIRKFHLAKLLRQERYDLIRGDIARRETGFGLDKTISTVSDADLGRMLKGLGIEADRCILWGDGSVYRELLYVDDLAGACIFLMQRYGRREIGECINIGTGEDMLVRDLALLVKDIVGFEGQIVYDSSKPSGSPRKLLDISKIGKMGWRSSISLRDGIDREYRWYVKN